MTIAVFHEAEIPDGRDAARAFVLGIIGDPAAEFCRNDIGGWGTVRVSDLRGMAESCDDPRGLETDAVAFDDELVAVEDSEFYEILNAAPDGWFATCVECDF